MSVTASAEKIVIKGSDTLGAKMVPQLAEAYKSGGGKATFEIAAEGSSMAFTSLLAGTADLGMSSRSATCCRVRPPSPRERIEKPVASLYNR